MDWKGLLNWTMKHNDGTVNKNLKPMSEEDMKFIESAFESVCVNEMKEIMKILDKLKQPELNTDEDKEIRVEELENLLIYIEGLENARNLVRAKRFKELINYFYSTQYKEVHIILADILTTMMQNDKMVQEAAMQFEIFNVLDLINKTQDKTLIAKYIYMLTGIIYGEGEKPKLMFMNDFDGFKLLYNLLIKNTQLEDVKNFKRILNVVRELTRIEDTTSENYQTKLLAVKKIKEINMHIILMEFLKKLEFNDVNFLEDDLDLMKILLQIFVNIVKLYDSLADILNLISEVNNKLNTSELLEEERKKEEKKFIIQILKSLKTEFAKEEDSTEEKNMKLEEIDNNGKQTLHLQLK